MALLKGTGGKQEDWSRLRPTVRFLKARYKGAGEAERAVIAALPSRNYGYDWRGPCWHEDASVHFDLPR